MRSALDKERWTHMAYTLLACGLLGCGVYLYAVDIDDRFIHDKHAGEVRPWFFHGHLVVAALVLVIGPVQFWPWFRKRSKNVHRLLGKVYLISALSGGLLAFPTIMAYDLPGARLSLLLLALLWVFFNAAAWKLAVAKRFDQHRRFMVRGYVCALAFVWIRLLPRINERTGLFDFIPDRIMRETVYEWICWVYPLVIAELFLTWWPALSTISSGRQLSGRV